VRWIETQDVIFDASMNVERLIEIGPSPTLAGMAQRTLKTKYEGYDQALGMQRQVLAYAKEGKEIYYNVDPPLVEEAAPVASAPAAAPVPAAAPAPVAAPAAAPSGPAAQIADEPVKALDIVHTVVAQKLKKTLEEVSPSKAIKDLVGGKSTLQVHLIYCDVSNSRMKFSVIYRRSSADYQSIPLKMFLSMNSVRRFNLPSEDLSGSSLPD
jgi:fatty acid synthase subunit alpha